MIIYPNLYPVKKILCWHAGATNFIHMCTLNNSYIETRLLSENVCRCTYNVSVGLARIEAKSQTDSYVAQKIHWE